MRSSRSHRSFQALTQRIAAVMGRHGNVSVTFGGDIAHASMPISGRYHINIPTMPGGTVLTEQQYRAYNGYVDHESAHVRWSDFKILEVKENQEHLLSHLINVVEDIRIENKQIDHYPGSRKFLDALAYHVDAEAALRPSKGDQAEEILELIYKECYAVYRSVDTGFIDGWLNDAPQLQPIAEAMAQLMPKMKTNQDAVNIAKRIKELLPKNVDWSKPVGKPGQPGSGEGNGQGQKVLATLSDAGNPFEGGREKKKSDKALEQAAKSKDSHKHRQESLGTLIGKIEKDNKALENLAKCELPEQGPVLPPCATHSDRIFVPSHEDAYVFSNTRNNCNAQILSAKKMLNIFLRSKKNVNWSRGLTEGQLDTSMLHNLVATGDTRVMKERRSADFVNTAVLLLIDCSGSMDAGLTRKAAIILAEALNGIKWMKLEVVGFTTDWYGNGYKDLPNCGRTEPLHLMLYKQFDEPYVKAQNRFGGLQTGGHTPLGESYGLGLERILPRKEARRVVWIISDGEPYLQLADRSHSEYELMRRSHMKCRSLGIETVGTYVGRRGGRLEKYVDRYGGIKNISEMPIALTEIIKGIVR